MSDISIPNTPPSCLFSKGGGTTKRDRKLTENPKEQVWRLGAWGRVGGRHKLWEVRVQRAAVAHLTVTYIWGCPCMGVKEEVHCVIWGPFLCFYAPSPLDIHVWAHKSPITKKSQAINRSLHCGWQCRTPVPVLRPNFWNAIRGPSGRRHITQRYVLALPAQPPLQPDSQFSDPFPCSNT